MTASDARRGMDDVDHGILKAVGFEPFVQGARDPYPWRPSVLAKRAGTSPRLAKDRLLRLERAGVIEGFDLMPNPALLGFQVRQLCYRFQGRGKKAEALAKLRLMEGVIGWWDFLSAWATVVVAYKSQGELDRKLALLKELLGQDEPETYLEVKPPATTRLPTRTEWRILQALRGDARKPVAQIAGETGVSSKTVQRSIQRLAKEGAIDMFARLSPQSIDHMLLCMLRLKVDESKAREAIGGVHDRFPQSAWYQCGHPIFEDGLHYDYVAAPRTPTALRDLLDSASKLPGILDVEGHVVSRIQWEPGWLDDQIALASGNVVQHLA
jgi:DNA-binding Lrp family transcriptional regulator